MRLNERSTDRRTTAWSAAGATTASVAAKQNIVARWGSSMPAPFAIPPSVTGRPSTSSRSAASLGFVSVVRIASAAARPPWGESDLASFGSAVRTLSIGSGTPMLPVEATRTWLAGIRNSSPTSHSISVAAIALGIHRGRLEPRALGPAEHDVEVLDAVGRAALAEVVDRGQADRATGPGIGHHRDVAVVRPDDPARRGPLALIQHADERLARVALAVDVEEFGRRERRGEWHGGGGEEPSVERHEVSREGDADRRPGERPELLLDLRRVAVARDPVRLHVLVRFGIEVHRLDLPTLRPGTRHAGLAVDHDAVEAREPAPEQGRRREDSAGRVTAR